MKYLIPAVLFFLIIADLSAGEIELDGSAEFRISSLTTLGLNIDEPYRFGLKNEMTSFSLIYHLFPYQELSNRIPSDEAVGYIDLTLFNLDILIKKALGYNPPGNLTTDRYQTGSFVAGIAWNNWVLQLNAGANEPFWSPWNKGLNYINDEAKFTWAYLTSMVDVVRTDYIYEMDPQTPAVAQFQQDVSGLSDRLGLNVNGQTIALSRTTDHFGMNIKASTEFSYDSPSITEDNYNGMALAVDLAFFPSFAPGLKAYVSTGGTYNFGDDSDPDLIMGGASIGYEHKFNDYISLEPSIGFDMAYLPSPDGTGMEYEASAALVMRWPGQGGWYTDYILNKEGRVFPGMALAYKFYGNNYIGSVPRHDLKFTLFEERGDEGVFYGLGSEIIVDFNDFTSRQRELLATVYLDYSIASFAGSSGTFQPWIMAAYDYIPYGTGHRNDVKTNLGLRMKRFIPNTDLGVEWDSGSLIPGNGLGVTWGYVKFSAEVNF